MVEFEERGIENTADEQGRRNFFKHLLKYLLAFSAFGIASIFGLKGMARFVGSFDLLHLAKRLFKLAKVVFPLAPLAGNYFTENSHDQMDRLLQSIPKQGDVGWIVNVGFFHKRITTGI